MTANQLIANQRKSLLLFAERAGNISKACKVFGVSRTTYYQLKKQLLKTGSLDPVVRSKPLMPNRTRLSAKKQLLRLLVEHPSWGPCRLSVRLRQEGILLSSVGVYYHLRRFGLNTRWRRLLYLEKIKAKDGILTQRTLKKFNQARQYQIKAEWPGDLVGQDTFYLGHLKGVGRIYQQTAIDCFSRFALAGLYTSCDHKAAVHFTEYKLIPGYFQHGVIVERLLTDRGTEYCNHEFNSMLSHYEITHVLTKPKRPQSNGIVERFQRTVLEEFYQKIFRTKFYMSIEELQDDLNQFLIEYNFFRPHQSLKNRYPIELFRPNNKILQQRFKKLLT